MRKIFLALCATSLLVACEEDDNTTNSSSNDTSLIGTCGLLRQWMISIWAIGMWSNGYFTFTSTQVTTIEYSYPEEEEEDTSCELYDQYVDTYTTSDGVITFIYEDGDEYTQDYSVNEDTLTLTTVHEYEIEEGNEFTETIVYTYTKQ